MSNTQELAVTFSRLLQRNRREIYITFHQNDTLRTELLFDPEEKDDAYLVIKAFGRGSVKTINIDDKNPEEIMYSVKIKRLTCEEIITILKVGLSIIPLE
jgi:hypothetical protein